MIPPAGRGDCWNTSMAARGARRGYGLRAWLVTGSLGRGVAFAIDFAVALRRWLAARR
jgi:hypothetical protein